MSIMSHPIVPESPHTGIMAQNATTHPFHSVRSEAPPRHASAFFHKGRLWICPAHNWTYDEVRRLCNGKKRGQHFPSSNPPVTSRLCQCQNHFLFVPQNRVFQAIPVFFAKWLTGSAKMFETSMLVQGRPLRLCPHNSLKAHQ